MEECGHKGLNCYEAGREIESLRQQLVISRDNGDALGKRLLNRVDECESLRQQLKNEKACHESWEQEHLKEFGVVTGKLATTQAYAAQLREALDSIRAENQTYKNISPVTEIVLYQALAFQADDTALRAAIADELERMADHGPWDGSTTPAYVITELRRRANELRNKP